MLNFLFSEVSRAHSTGQNLNTGISVFLVYETGILVFQKQTFFSVNFYDHDVKWCNEKTSNYLNSCFKSNFYYNNKYCDKNINKNSYSKNRKETYI
jgi:hypothetical protein